METDDADDTESPVAVIEAHRAKGSLRVAVVQNRVPRACHVCGGMVGRGERKLALKCVVPDVVIDADPDGTTEPLGDVCMDCGDGLALEGLWG